MSQTLQLIQTLVADGEVRISEHGYDELAADRIPVRDILSGIAEAILLEDYPEYFKGPCVLVLQKDREGSPIHVVWGDLETNKDSWGARHRLSPQTGSLVEGF